MTNRQLFQPYNLGPITLANHIVMAPLTRNRAAAGLVPSELAAPLAALIPETLYGGGAEGYTDYPSLTEVSK